jgi:hypothetical protein
MCEQCKQLNARIDHYERLAKLIHDELTIAGLKKLIADLQQKRAALEADPAHGKRG